MSYWGILLVEMTQGLAEVVVVGKQARELRQKLHQKYLPLTLTLGAVQRSTLPHFQGREAKDEQTMIYVCRNKSCQMPTDKVDVAVQLILG